MSLTPQQVVLVQSTFATVQPMTATAAELCSVQQALLWTLALILQDEYTSEVRSAWASAYAMLAGVMKEAAWGVP